jgi:protocatechuate 3,4-dioxygenase beta subunit
MDQDDRPIGRILNRREVLALLGTTGAAFLAACVGIEPAQETPVQGTTPSPQNSQTAAAGSPTGELSATAASTTASANALTCVVRPELTEGPYFVDEQLNRADIRGEPADGSVKAGLPLVLSIHVSQLSSDACVPLAGAQIDVWHCDAQGIYSGVVDNRVGFDTVEQKFLRGYQIADENGQAQFVTIYPGWYPGRAVHIHFKVRAAAPDDSDYEFTSQFFFDDAVSDEVFNQEPYASQGQRTTRNQQDGIFRNGGEQLLLPLTRTAEGYETVFNLALDFSDIQTGRTTGILGG